MRPLIVALAVLVFLAPAVPAAPLEEPKEWVVWSEDGQDFVVSPAGGDIDTVRVGATAGGLHVRLDTFDTPAPSMAASSGLRFVVEQGDPASVRFAWEEEPMLWIDDEPAGSGWQVSEDSGAHGWHLEIWWTSVSVAKGGAFSLRDLHATAATGVLTDTATGPDLAFMPTASGSFEAAVLSLQAGITIEGPDYGGGTSVTVDERGRPLLAYYVYDETEGSIYDQRTPRGIYLARIDAVEGSFLPERISETRITREHGGRDGQMRTQIAHDGARTFVLFTDDPAVDHDEDGPGHPGTPDSVYVLAREGDTWVREDPTPDGASDVGAEDVADLAARDGRVVAAVPVGDEVWIVERTGPGSWQVMKRIQGATNAKIALDSGGGVHAAYVVYGPDGNLRDGGLYYASSRDAFDPTHIGDNIDAGWEGPETDGSFAIAVGPRDQVALLWNDGRARDRDEEQRIAIREGDAWIHDFAPLTPVHGNPQYTMRLGYTQTGHVVAGSGYGGTDSLAVRAAHGAWSTLDLSRYDVWDMAVAPPGLIYFGYTQPHGGTTVALSVYGDPAGVEGDNAALLGAGAERRGAPGLGLGALAVALVAVVLRRR